MRYAHKSGQHAARRDRLFLRENTPTCSDRWPADTSRSAAGDRSCLRTRSASDRRRHKEKIEKAIKDGIHDIVAEESIIGQDGKKKIKIPVRGIKEYQFIYGKNNPRVGSGQGKDVKKGQQIGKTPAKRRKGKGQPDKPGNSAGEEFYEVDISLDELAKYLFDDLNLPDLEKKSFPNIFNNTIKRKGYRKEGIRPRLSKKETIKRKIRRKKASIKAGTFDPENDERFTFHKDDLKYKHIEVTKKNVTNATIFFIMDTSGSMTKDKKYKAITLRFVCGQYSRYTSSQALPTKGAYMFWLTRKKL